MTTTAANPPASLLTIPCELRNAVYSYVFCTDPETNEPSPFSSESNDLVNALQLETPPSAHPPSASKQNSTRPSAPPSSNRLTLLLTCRQIHAEAHALALHHTPFHLYGDSAEPECFRSLAAPLLHSPRNHDKLSAIRHLSLTAKISHLRALNERWNGFPFGQTLLDLHTLTLVPQKPECHASAYAEVADLSQSHTLAYIVAESAKTLRQVRCLVVRNEGCFSEVVWRLVYRSLVYRIWRWAGPHAGLRFECSGELEAEGREWLRVWIGEGEDGECRDAREVGDEVARLVGGKEGPRAVEDIPGL